MRLNIVNDPQATRNHDGLVVAPNHAVDDLLVFAKIAQQIGPAKFVVERCTAQRAFCHDLQGACNVCWFPIGAVPQFRDCEARQTRLGFGATSRCAFIPNFAASAGGSAREGGNSGWVVVSFDLHQHMVKRFFFLIDAALFRHKTLDFMTCHDRRVVGISHDRVLWILLMGMSNHAKQTVRLVLSINGELRIENFVSAMLAVGLRKHHQFNVTGVSAQLFE